MTTLRTRQHPPWRIVTAGVVYAAFYLLLVYCDVFRPEQPGVEVEYRPDGFLVTGVTPDSPASRAGLRPADLITTWDGRPSGQLDLAIIEGNITFDQPVPVAVQRAGQLVEPTLTFRRESWDYWRTRQGWMLLAARAVQLVSLVLAFVVVFNGRPTSTTYFGAWILATFAVFAVVPPYRFAAVWRSLPMVVGLPLWFPYLSSMAITAVLASFLAVFPRHTPRPRLSWAGLWLPMAAALVIPGHYLVRLVYAPEQVVTARPGFWLLIAVSAGYLIWGVTRLVRTYQQLDDVTERRRVRVLANGLVVGCLFGVWVIPMYYVTRAELGYSLFASPWMAAGTFLLLAFPISFSYAILRHRLFDTNLLIRQGVRYALARRVVVGLVPAFLVLLIAELALRHPHDELLDVLRTHSLTYALVGGLILTVRWRRARWLDGLDRRFFRDRYSAQQLLRRVATELRDADSLESVAPGVAGQLESAFHAEFAAVLARQGSGGAYVPVAASPLDRAPAPISAGSTFVALIGLLGRPLEVGLPDARWLSRRLPPEEVAQLRDSGLELVAPVGRGARAPSALLALGLKRSEEPYTDDDLDLVAAIATNLALLERAAPTVAAGRALAACPACGECFGPDTATCPRDDTVLVPVAAPQVVAGRYRLTRRLGEGGMGTVFAATDEALNRQVAVKLIRQALADRGQVADRFEHEARTAASLAHPNVVTVHDFGATDSGPYLVMELLEGSTLRDLMDRERPLPPARTREILRGLCAALTAAHARKLVHRDLKPENVFLATTSDGSVPKILDFGVAKSHLTPAMAAGRVSTAPGVLIGTPHYMSPEQLAGGEAGPTSDVWALGVMAFEMLTGLHPLGDIASSPDHVAQEVSWIEETIEAADLPPAWKAFFRLALARAPDRRPATATAFLAEFERMLVAPAGPTASSGPP